MDSGYYTTGEKEFLLKIAQKSLEKFLLEGEKFEPQTINKKLWEKRGVFVTLSCDNKLRGCMGNIEPTESLILAIRNNVLLAASDRRFSPLSFSELQSVEVEISILSELKKVATSDIKFGDGVLVRRGEKSAAYLPSVWKSLSDKNKFLLSLCERSGIDPAFYDDSETNFWIYQTISFG